MLSAAACFRKFGRELVPRCGFQDLSREIDITNLPSAKVEVSLQRRERRQVDLLRGGLRVFFREFAVADEESHDVEVLSEAPCVHLEAGEVLEGLLQDSLLGKAMFR